MLVSKEINKLKAASRRLNVREENKREADIIDEHAFSTNLPKALQTIKKENMKRNL